MTEQYKDAWQEQWKLWGKQDRLSLVDFTRLTRTYLTRISATRESIECACALFNEQAFIEADQCNKAIALIKTMDKPVEELAQFLDKKECLPIVILPLRYQVIAELASMRDYLWKAKALMGRFRTSCRNASREAAMQRYEIIGKLESLLQGGEDIVQLSQAMFDRARFQERRDYAPAFSPLSGATWGSLHEFSSYQKKR